LIDYLEEEPMPPYPRELMKTRGETIAYIALLRVGAAVPGAFRHLDGKEYNRVRSIIAQEIDHALTPAETPKPFRYRRPKAV
jgi:hypothetical protein